MKEFLLFVLLVTLTMVYACQKNSYMPTDVASAFDGASDRGDSLGHHCDSLHLDSLGHHHHHPDSLGHHHLDSLGHHHLDSLGHHHPDSLDHPPFDTTGQGGGHHGGGHHGGGHHGGGNHGGGHHGGN